MPFQNIITKHIDAAKRALIFAAIGQLEALVQPYLHNLSEEENKGFRSLSDQEKLFVNKVDDYRISQPNLCSTDVDWNEFVADTESRDFYQKVIMRLNALVNAMTETRRLHDHDLYENALTDFKHAKYKEKTEKGVGYDSKVEELKQFFSKGGKRSLTDEI